MLGQALLFGRQTDREARLEIVNVPATNCRRSTDGRRCGGGDRRAGTEARSDRPLVGQSEVAADRVAAAAGRLGGSIARLVEQHGREAILDGGRS